MFRASDLYDSFPAQVTLIFLNHVAPNQICVIYFDLDKMYMAYMNLFKRLTL